jgi:hypothetical protein
MGHVSSYSSCLVSFDVLLSCCVTFILTSCSCIDFSLPVGHFHLLLCSKPLILCLFICKIYLSVYSVINFSSKVFIFKFYFPPIFFLSILVTSWMLHKNLISAAINLLISVLVHAEVSTPHTLIWACSSF